MRLDSDLLAHSTTLEILNNLLGELVEHTVGIGLKPNLWNRPTGRIDVVKLDKQLAQLSLAELIVVEIRIASHCSEIVAVLGTERSEITRLRTADANAMLGRQLGLTEQRASDVASFLDKSLLHYSVDVGALCHVMSADFARIARADDAIRINGKTNGLIALFQRCLVRKHGVGRRVEADGSVDVTHKLAALFRQFVAFDRSVTTRH